MSSGRWGEAAPGAPGRPGPALLALGVIVVVTVAWWALALVPVAAATTPEWLARTRLACFGAPPGGLPSAGGWVLLVGEPIGMLAILLSVWRDALWHDLRWLAARPAGRTVLGAAAVALSWGAFAAVSVVRRATAEPFDPAAGLTSAPIVLDAIPRLVLTDQHGNAFDLARDAGGPVLLTFAYAHCADVCPTLVRDVLRARSGAQRSDITVVVVTVDPWRDVPPRLAAIAASWGLEAQDRLLSGSVTAVTATLADWGVGWSRDAATGDVAHAPVVMLLDQRAGTAVRMAGAGRLAAMLKGPG